MIGRGSGRRERAVHNVARSRDIETYATREIVDIVGAIIVCDRPEPVF